MGTTSFVGAMVIVLIALAAGASSEKPVAPPEQAAAVFSIDGISYAVPQHWLQHHIDNSRLARPGDLVRLPDELAFEDFEIYVTAPTRDAFVRMAAAAGRDSVLLLADSGFRSKSYQTRIIKTRMALGETIETILLSVAPPGFSEHHTGRALDLCPSEARFAYTDTYKWLQANAAAFGFVESMPKTASKYVSWEAWHWYYVGD